MTARIAAALAAILFSAAIAEAAPLAIGIETAAIGVDQGQPVLNLTLDAAGTSAFADFTKANVGRTIELRIDGETMLSAVLRDPILAGKIEVSGHDRADLERVAGRLAAGAARVEVEAR